MSFDLISAFFMNILVLLSSVALFLGTIRFGDRIVSVFKKR